MAEAGSIAEKVKQQADIVRVVGEYVRLKKAGKDFSGLCPFHQEKTPSFTVSPIKQIFYCFGCGKGGDVYNFIMEMEKCEFPEALKLVAEKCGISIPRPKEQSAEGRKENQQRAVLVEMHREAQSFFVKQLEGTLEGKAARAYLEDRGLDKDAVARFGIGYAPSGGDVFLRHLKSKYNEKLLTESGLISRDQGGKLFDRFRRRITFPIANESGKVIAFGCRALGDDQPKYLNSPESPIYSKSNVLYHLDRAKEGIRRQDFVILVEGYMDAIAVARAGISNVVASCGTSLAEQQIKLLGRFTKRVIVNYDPDAAGQSATERSLSLLLEQDFEVRVLALPPVGDKKADPDLFIRERGVEEYTTLLKKAPPYVAYLVERAKQMGVDTAELKVKAVNFLLPYVQKIPNPILRKEWAAEVAARLRLEDPMLRAAFARAAKERRSEVKLQPELTSPAVNRAERRLIRMLTEAEGFRQELVQRLQNAQLYHGLETEKIFAALVTASLSGRPMQATEAAATLEERDRRLLFEILLEEASEPTWTEARSCINVLRGREVRHALIEVQEQLAHAPPFGSETNSLMLKKGRLQAELAGVDKELEEEEKKKREEDPFADLRDPELLAKLKKSGMGG